MQKTKSESLKLNDFCSARVHELPTASMEDLGPRNAKREAIGRIMNLGAKSSAHQLTNP